MVYENEFQNSRLAYNEKHDKTEKLSQETVAELADVSLSTIKRVESGDTLPNPCLAAKLSKIYDDQSIVKNYCASHCEVGKVLEKKVNTNFKPNSLFEAGYGLITANQELESFRLELFDILADGRIDPDEMIRLKEVLGNLDQVQEIIDVIKEMIKNLEDFDK